jgi:hypothetical protein
MSQLWRGLSVASLGLNCAGSLYQFKGTHRENANLVVEFALAHVKIVNDSENFNLISFEEHHQISLEIALGVFYHNRKLEL